MTTILIATLLSVKFAGGTPNEFAVALAESTNQSVMVSQGDARYISKAEFETVKLSDMARDIRAQTLLTIVPGTDLILSDQFLARRFVTGAVLRGGFEADEAPEILSQRVASIGLPAKLAAPTPEAMFSVTPGGLPPSALAGGKVTFKTEKANALQAPLLNGSLSKPVAVHWIYQETPVFVNVKDLSELDFLTWVAKAIGARLNPAGKTFHFDLDPLEVRKRAVATILAISTRSGREEPGITQKGRTFRVACLNALTPAQLTEALAAPGATARIELGPRSPLTNLALQRVRDLEQYQRSLPVDSPAPRTAIGLLQRVDRSRMAALMVDSRFGVRLEVPVVDENGRSAGVVRFN